MRTLDYNKVEEMLVKFIQKEFAKAGFTKAVIGMSGGIDSAVVANLAVKALGADNVHGILMPFNKIPESIEDDVQDAKTLCRHLGMKYHIVDITGMVDAIEPTMKKNRKTKGDNYTLRLGNIMARVRMITLFDYSSANDALVLGTENYTENQFGYFTMHGDGASCVEPIIPLFKTEVFQLANQLGLPEFILIKKPSARLWGDHTDERELGISYDDADVILFYHTWERWGMEDFLHMGFDETKVSLVLNQVKRNRFKHTLPVLPDDDCFIEECSDLEILGR